MRTSSILAITAVLALLLMDRPASGQRPTLVAADKSTVEKHIAGWKQKPRETATLLIGKYGLPHEATAQRLIWHGNGPWKRSELVNEEIPHDFPMPHHDLLLQTIDYRVGAATKVGALFEYDGSVIVERTKGELAARCDKEEANFLAINLAHDVVLGKRNVEDARKFYAESIALMMKGKPNEYVQGFRFKPPAGDQGDRDKAVM
jgi:hypothetical protein